MGLKKYIKKYKDYETKELSRRAVKKKKLQAYKELKSKNIITKKPKRRFDTTTYSKVIGNPYSIKFPKAKKILKKVRKAKRRKLKRKVVIVYR